MVHICQKGHHMTKTRTHTKTKTKTIYIQPIWLTFVKEDNFPLFIPIIIKYIFVVKYQCFTDVDSYD